MIEIIPNWHPLLVHFPIAFVTAAMFFLTGGTLFRDKDWAKQWTLVGRWLLWSAALFACVAAAFGWLAFNSVEHDDSGHIAMLAHRNWALAALAVLVPLALWDARRHRSEQTATIGLLAMLAVAWLLVTSTAWHGAELVYRHGLGVLSLPDPGADEHGHDHAAAHEHGEAAPAEEK